MRAFTKALIVLAASCAGACAVLAESTDTNTAKPVVVLRITLTADGNVVVHGQEMGDIEFRQTVLRELRQADPRPRAVIQAGRNTLPDRITDLVDRLHNAGVHDVYVLGADQEYKGLEFRIAATTTNMPALYNEMTGRRISEEHAKEMVDQARRLLGEQGPNSPRGRSDPFWWFPIREGIYDHDLLLGVWDAKPYALLANRDPATLLHVPGGPRWHVQRVSQVQDTFHHAAIEFELDDAGGRLQTDLTAYHQGQPLAILIDDTVQAAPLVKKPIGARGMITGGNRGWDEKSINEIVKALSGEAVGIAASQPATQPATKPAGAVRQ